MKKKVFTYNTNNVKQVEILDDPSIFYLDTNNVVVNKSAGHFSRLGTGTLDTIQNQVKQLQLILVVRKQLKMNLYW